MNHISAQQLKDINQTVLRSLQEKSETKIIGNFTKTAIKLLKADFGFAWLKTYGQSHFELAYKSPNLPYNPVAPRKKGHNYKVLHSQQPFFMERVKKLQISKYDVSPFMKSYVILPISNQNKSYGNIVLCYKQHHVFSEAEKNLCVFIGNSTAQALTIGRFYKILKETIEKRTKELKQKNRELVQDRDKDEAILSSIGDGIVAIDKDGKIFIFNPQAELITGLFQEEVMGQPVWEKMPIYDEPGNPIPQNERAVNKILKGDLKKYVSKDGQYYLKHKDGTRVPIALTVTPIIHRGLAVGAIQVFRDITAEKEIDRAKSEIISLASHQLRTPLSAINWYSEALMGKDLGELNKSQKKYLKEIYIANQRMIELVYDFLNVSRIELGTFTLKVMSLDIKEIVEGLINELEPQIRQKNLHVSHHFDPHVPLLEADRKLVRIIVQNLLSNAVKYTPGQGKVKVEVSRSGKNQILIKVTDTGYGIPKESQDKIFNKLFRADNVKDKAPEGSGLGLYIVKSFVDYCGGKIWFTSKVNQGTNFFVELPIKR